MSPVLPPEKSANSGSSDDPDYKINYSTLDVASGGTPVESITGKSSVEKGQELVMHYFVETVLQKLLPASDSVFGGVRVESFSEGASEGTDSGAGEASFLESGPPEVSTDAIAGESAGFRGNDDEDSQEQENKVKRSRTAI
ncbi:hypothetical protein L5515_018557 [Caenorhabditis briggsae]|uniref:Uncharacterized protein n=1 Tax=Caenorhabditis briggsae TaxID=6238 RepID=A0AAE9JT13_CAEBR|nr:hypothetical protein L5515_018557 [Caenorhabditis briggsae]